MNVIKTNYSPYILLLLFFFFFFFLAASTLVAVASNVYVEEACSVTKYRDLCVKSLASFSDEAKRSPSKWARAGVSVTIGEIKGLLRYLEYVTKYGRRTGSRRAALADCVEVVQDALDNLHQSLHVLRKLNKGEFGGQMSDVLTWVSSALTDEDTCTGTEGLEERRGKGRRGRGVREVERRVVTATYMTSNALALANKLATSSFESSLGVDHD